MDSYHHGNLRAELLAHAKELIYASPTGEAPSLRELARRAGVSATAVYHHFPSKETLLAEVAVSLLETLLEEWAPMTLSHIGTAYLAFFRQHPSALGLMFGSRLRSVPRVRQLQDEAYQALVDRLPPLPSGGPDHAKGLALWALVQGLAHLFAAGTLGADEAECPGGPGLWYQEPDAVLEALAPAINRLLAG